MGFGCNAASGTHLGGHPPARHDGGGARAQVDRRTGRRRAARRWAAACRLSGRMSSACRRAARGQAAPRRLAWPAAPARAPAGGYLAAGLAAQPHAGAEHGGVAVVLDGLAGALGAAGVLVVLAVRAAAWCRGGGRATLASRRPQAGAGCTALRSMVLGKAPPELTTRFCACRSPSRTSCQRPCRSWRSAACTCAAHWQGRGGCARAAAWGQSGCTGRAPQQLA